MDRAIPKAVLLTIMAVVGIAIALGVVAYFIPGGEHVFLDEKLPVSRELLWAVCLRVHVAGGLICLFTAILLVVKWTRRIHKPLGYAYALSVLVLLCPAGFYLAAFAKGGVWGTVGFTISGVIAFVSTVIAVRHAVGRNIRAHRAWVWRSFAQIGSAVTFRVLHFAFDELGLVYETNYLLSLYLSVLGNAAVAEVFIWRQGYEAVRNTVSVALASNHGRRKDHHARPHLG